MQYKKWYSGEEVEKDFYPREDHNREIREKTQQLTDVKHTHSLDIAQINSNHALAMKEKEFEMKHFKDAEIQKLEKDIVEKDKTIVKLETENKSLSSIVEVDAHILDVKEVVNQLFSKIPNVNITAGLSLPGAAQGGKQDKNQDKQQPKKDGDQ